MTDARDERLSHSIFTRRRALQVGSIGLLGLGTADLASLRSMEGANPDPAGQIGDLRLSHRRA